MPKSSLADTFSPITKPPVQNTGNAVENALMDYGSMPTAQPITNFQPKSLTDYMATGGLNRDFQAAMANVNKKKMQREYQKRFEQLIQLRERGAMAAYNDAIQKYGEDIQPYLPNPTIYYDDNGNYNAVKFYEDVAVGLDKFRKDKFETDKIAQERQDFQAAAPIIQNAKTPIEAASGVMQQGIDPSKISSVMSQYPKPITDLEKQKAEAEIKYKKALAEKANREQGSGTGSNATDKDPAFTDARTELLNNEKRKAALTAQLKTLEASRKQAELRGFNTADIDEQIAQTKAEQTINDAELKVARNTLHELAKSRKSDIRKATWESLEKDVINPATENVVKEAQKPLLSPMSQDLNDPSKRIQSVVDTSSALYTPILKDEVTARAKTKMGLSPSVSPNATGDPDIISAIRQNPRLWEQYQNASSMDQARMRAKVRQAMGAN